jgi:hypothetical protein
MNENGSDAYINETISPHGAGLEGRRGQIDSARHRYHHFGVASTAK